VLALLPGTALLAALLLGLAAERRAGVGIAVLSLAAVSALAIADWTRPTAEPHPPGPLRAAGAGRRRRARDRAQGEAANLGLLRDAPVIVVVALPLLVLVITALVRPDLLRLHALARAQQEDPALRALLISALTTGLLGFAANDSGVIVPAVALGHRRPADRHVWAQRWMNEAA